MKKLVYTAILVLLASLAFGQIRLTEVNPMMNTVKIKNFGMMATNVSSYVICDEMGNYPMVTSVGSPMMIMANQEVTLTLSSSMIGLSGMSGNLALYMNSMNYSMAANMTDFVQWGAASGGRESVAVMKGIWMSGAFLMTPAPFTYTGTGSEMGNRMPFWSNSTGSGGGGMMGMMMDIPHSNTFLFAARLNGDSEVPSVTTDGIGVAGFFLNGMRDSLFITLNVAGLNGNVTEVMLNEGMTGQTGALVYDLTPQISGKSVCAVITGDDLTDMFLAKLFGGMYYINVKTDVHTTGEIRGQIHLERDMMFKGMLSDEAHVHAVNVGMNNNPWGLATFGLSQDKKEVNYMVVADDLTANIQMATLMYGREGVAQNMVYNLSNDIRMGMPIVQGTIDVEANPAFVDSLMMGSVYINLTTMNNPMGEVRGQLMMDKSLNMDVMMDTSQVMGSTVMNSNAMGLGLFNLNYTLDTFQYDVVVTGLTGAITKVEILDATDMNTMIMLDDITMNVSGNRISGMLTGFNHQYIDIFLKGDICLRVSTMMNPMGETAGHVIKFARDGYLLNMTGDQVVNGSTSTGIGSGIISTDRSWTNAHYMAVASDLTSTVTNAGFFAGNMGETATMMQKNINSNLTTVNDGVGYFGFWSDMDMTQPFMMMNGTQLHDDSLYLQINTMMNTAGELRGQTKAGKVCTPMTVSTFNQLSIENLNVYPNPSFGQLNIQVNSETIQDVLIQMVDNTGRVVFSENENLYNGENNLTLNLEHQANGIYHLIMNNGNQVWRTKVVLMR